MLFRSRHVALLFALFAASNAPAAPPLSSGAHLPQSITVQQRSSTPLAAMGLPLEIVIGDITGGEVLTRLVAEGGTNALSPRTMRAGDDATFAVTGRRLNLHLDALDNALVGEDYATFTVSAVSNLSETEKIERLLAAMQSLGDARFIRNGKEYPPDDAVAHLRRKWKAAAGQPDDAKRFIEALASTSSMTGKPYEIRYADGRSVTLREFLLKELGQIEAQ